MEQNNFVESTISFVILTKHFCYHYKIIWLSETKNSTKKFGWSNKTFCQLYIKQIILLRQPNFCWHYQTVFSVYSVCTDIIHTSWVFNVKVILFYAQFYQISWISSFLDVSKAYNNYRLAFATFVPFVTKIAYDTRMQWCYRYS